MSFSFLFPLTIIFLTYLASPALLQMRASAADSLVFPLKAAKQVILDGSSYNGETMVWCNDNQNNCHHHYNAADIFAATGTQVVSAVKGIVTRAHKSESVGHTVHVLGEDGIIYYHAHLGSISVSVDQNVEPGTEIGTVGTAEDAEKTPPHLHFDMLHNNGELGGLRPRCGHEISCTIYPFINPQPQLVAAFNGDTGGGPPGPGAPGQVVKSNCWVTKVGDTGDRKPTLPPDCQSSSVPTEGLISPPNLECRPNGYCQLPESDDGSYVFESYTPPSQRWGTRELVDVIYTVAKQWKREYPSGRLHIGDLTAYEDHDSHKYGTDVDLDATTDGTHWAADFSNWSIYDQDATVKLGKMFANTGLIKVIFYNDQPAVDRVLDYSPGENPSKGMQMYNVVNHHHHFHVRVNADDLCYVGPDC